MKNVTVNSAKFATALKEAKKLVKTNGVLPILENFLIEVTGDRQNSVLTVNSTDLENWCKVSIPCEASENFRFTLPWDELKFIEKLDLQPVTIETDIIPEKDGQIFKVSICAEGETGKSTAENPDDFPKQATGKICPVALLENDFLAELKTALKYVSNDDLRPAMTGIYFATGPTGIEIVATDAHLLRRSNLEGLVNDKISFIINPTVSKFLTGFKKVENLEAGIITHTHAHNDQNNYTTGVFSFNYNEMKIEIFGRNIDARYPDYNAVIPTNNPIKIAVDKKTFAGKIDKALLYANKTTFKGRFYFNGCVKLQSEDLDFCKEYNTELPYLTKEGADLEIGFNMQFMGKILKDVSTAAVNMEFSTPTRAGIITDGNSLTLIMPVMLGAE